MDPSHNYVVAVTSGVARFHRPTCKRLAKLAPKIVGRIGDRIVEDAWPNAEPATCCKPNPDELRRQRNEASSAKADAEQSAADARIVEVTAAVKAGEPIPAAPAAVPAPAAVAAPKSRDRHPLYLEAIAAKKAAAHVGRSAKGRKVTDDEMADHMRAARALRPDTTMSQEMEIAYWIDGLALTRTRWNAVWVRTFGSPLASVAS